MYAVIETGGKQYKVAEGETISVERLKQEKDTAIAFDKVLLISDGKTPVIGQPYVEGASVAATVLDEQKDKKILITTENIGTVQGELFASTRKDIITLLQNHFDMYMGELNLVFLNILEKHTPEELTKFCNDYRTIISDAVGYYQNIEERLNYNQKATIIAKHLEIDINIASLDQQQFDTLFKAAAISEYLFINTATKFNYDEHADIFDLIATRTGECQYFSCLMYDIASEISLDLNIVQIPKHVTTFIPTEGVNEGGVFLESTSGNIVSAETYISSEYFIDNVSNLKENTYGKEAIISSALLELSTSVLLMLLSKEYPAETIEQISNQVLAFCERARFYTPDNSAYVLFVNDIAAITLDSELLRQNFEASKINQQYLLEDVFSFLTNNAEILKIHQMKLHGQEYHTRNVTFLKTIQELLGQYSETIANN